MSKERKYAFSWDLIGDIESGRANLGNQTSVEAYRLMQFTFRDAIDGVCQESCRIDFKNSYAITSFYIY